MTDLLKQLATHLNASERKDGEYHADCPFCGKPADPHQTHFAIFYSHRDSGWRYKCQVCGQGGGLRKLANRVGLESGDYVAPDYHQERVKVESSVFPYDLINRYERHPKRIELWQDYKPIPEELIIRYRLGVGRLPKEDGKFFNDERLIVPLIRGGKLVMLRGRSTSNHPTKWMTRGTPARLFNGDLITTQSIVVVMENWVDALLAMILLPDVTPVATSGGASTWLEGWSKHIAGVKPKGVILAMDNDEAGQKGNVNVANSLLKAGYKGKVKFHEYSPNAPYKSSLVDNLGG